MVSNGLNSGAHARRRAVNDRETSTPHEPDGAKRVVMVCKSLGALRLFTRERLTNLRPRTKSIVENDNRGSKVRLMSRAATGTVILEICRYQFRANM
jgi:hypothetical protein